MSWFSWLVWGFAATAVLTTLMAGSEGLGVTRMNMPHMLGTMFTPNRDRAKAYGVVLHFLNGWAFSIVYVAAFHAAHVFTWWFGMLIGLVHAAFVLAVAAPAMPGVHPRMASALRGPTVSRQLEPPGFLALNYGARTPISVLIAHLAFGAILGGFYRPPDARQRAACNVASVELRSDLGSSQVPIARNSSPSRTPSSLAMNEKTRPHDVGCGPIRSSPSESEGKMLCGSLGAGTLGNLQVRSIHSPMFGVTTTLPSEATVRKRRLVSPTP